MASENIFCEFCKEIFTDRGTLKQHLYEHAEEKTNRCAYCDKRFRNQAHLIKHFRIHTGEKPYSCDACLQDFSDESIYKKHSLICHAVSPLFEPTEKANGHGHNDQVSEQCLTKQEQLKLEDQHTCEICMETFGSETEIREHFHLIHDTQDSNESVEMIETNTPNKEKPEAVCSRSPVLSCAFCGLWFRDALNWQDHEKRHLLGEIFHCNECERYFDDQKSFQHHMFTHSSSNRKLINEMNLSFTNLRQLLNTTSEDLDCSPEQKLTKHSREPSEQNNSFKCKICSTSFKSQLLILKHFEKHKKEIDLECNICDNAFNDLEKHLLFHIESKQVKQPQKKRQNSIHIKKSKLKKAMDKLATNGISCTTCSKQFYSQSNLQRHMLIHSAIKPYSCCV